MRRFVSGLTTFCLASSIATVYAEITWVLWEHSYEVWVDNNKEAQRRT